MFKVFYVACPRPKALATNGRQAHKNTCSRQKKVSPASQTELRENIIPS